jgi:hypothetical protein
MILARMLAAILIASIGSQAVAQQRGLSVAAADRLRPVAYAAGTPSILPTVLRAGDPPPEETPMATGAPKSSYFQLGFGVDYRHVYESVQFWGTQNAGYTYTSYDLAGLVVEPMLLFRVGDRVTLGPALTLGFIFGGYSGKVHGDVVSWGSAFGLNTQLLLHTTVRVVDELSLVGRVGLGVVQTFVGADKGSGGPYIYAFSDGQLGVVLAVGLEYRVSEALGLALLFEYAPAVTAWSDQYVYGAYGPAWNAADTWAIQVRLFWGM